jgi:hypothetical protein
MEGMKGRHHRYPVKKAQGLVPLRTAVVHPVDEVSLAGAIEAGKEKLLVPVLVGPEHKIRAAASAADLDLSGHEIVPTEHRLTAVVVAHLGSGASMCGMKQRRSVATTMGLTALDGLPWPDAAAALTPASCSICWSRKA